MLTILFRQTLLTHTFPIFLFILASLTLTLYDYAHRITTSNASRD